MCKKLENLRIRAEERLRKMKDYVFIKKDINANENFKDLENEVYSNIINEKEMNK